MGVDDDDVVRVAALGFRDHVVVRSVRLDDRIDAETHHRRRLGLDRLIEGVSDGEGRERDRNVRDDGVPVGVDQAP